MDDPPDNDGPPAPTTPTPFAAAVVAELAALCSYDGAAVLDLPE
jgi:hypothetical protein